MPVDRSLGRLPLHNATPRETTGGSPGTLLFAKLKANTKSPTVQSGRVKGRDKRGGEEDVENVNLADLCASSARTIFCSLGAPRNVIIGIIPVVRNWMAG